MCIGLKHSETIIYLPVESWILPNSSKKGSKKGHVFCKPSILNGFFNTPQSLQIRRFPANQMGKNILIHPEELRPGFRIVQVAIGSFKPPGVTKRRSSRDIQVPKTNSLPVKIGLPKRKLSSSNQQLSGANC